MSRGDRRHHGDHGRPIPGLPVPRGPYIPSSRGATSSWWSMAPPTAPRGSWRGWPPTPGLRCTGSLGEAPRARKRGKAIGSAYRAALELARARMGGRGWIVEVQWRLKYMRASREIAIYGDAAALNSRERLGPSRLLWILARELWKSYVRPTDPYQRFFWYAEEGAEPAPIVPVFRYRVLLPGGRAGEAQEARVHVRGAGGVQEAPRGRRHGLRALRGERGRRGSGGSPPSPSAGSGGAGGRCPGACPRRSTPGSCATSWSRTAGAAHRSTGSG